MKLVASCSCGRKIQAKASLAGQKVRCPSCGSVLRLPHSKPTAAEKVADPLAELLDEIGYHSARSKLSCPECKVSLPTGAVLCVQCGYHLSKGKRLTTKRSDRGG